MDTRGRGRDNVRGEAECLMAYGDQRRVYTFMSVQQVPFVLQLIYCTVGDSKGLDVWRVSLVTRNCW